MFKLNPLTAIDSYKLAHRAAYPEGTEYVYSNFTPRSVNHLNVPAEYKTNEIVWFGGYAVIKEMVDFWHENFFSLPESGNGSCLGKTLYEFQQLVAPFAGADYPVEHLVELWKLGYLPLEIKQLPEGSRVPVGVPVFTIRNTDPRFAWLTNYLETYLSSELWKMSTSATIASYYRKIIEKYAEETGGSKEFIDFQAHDFSYRGMSGSIDAAKSGAGHLLSFKGTDTIPAVEFLNYYYKGKETFVGASVPATEHSVQCAYENDDYEYIKRIVTEIYPSGIVSVVSDGYDYWNVLTNVLPRLKDEILGRSVNELGMSKVVVRPDSGDPVRIICGYTVGEFESEEKATSYIKYDIEYEDKQRFDLYSFDGKIYNVKVERWPDYVIEDVIFTESKLTEAEVKGSIQVLWDTFGGTTNDKGFKTLNQRVGLIYGDSITLARADEILRRLKDKGFASDNVVFGVGSYTYQYNTRDTLGFAMKATAITVNGQDIPLFKEPKTDSGTKKSAKGYLKVDVSEEGKYVLKDNVSYAESQVGSALKTIFKDGDFKDLNIDSLEVIRERVNR